MNKNFMKVLIAFAICVSNVAMGMAQETYTKCNEEAVYVSEGMLDNSSNVHPIFNLSKGEMPNVGDIGEMSKYFETKLGNKTISGWLLIGIVKIESVVDEQVKAKVLERRSVVSVNGNDKNQFEKGALIKFSMYNYTILQDALEYYENSSQIYQKGKVRCGKKEGEWVQYYENGNIEAKLNYKNDVRVGKYEGWDTLGYLMLTGTYKNNLPDGIWIKYYRNGIKQRETEIVDSIKNGFFIERYESGKTMSEGNFINGEREGTWKLYYDNGRIGFELEYINGKRNGLWKNWSYQGDFAAEGYYKDDYKTGTWFTYWPSGKIKEEQNYQTGKITGKYCKYYSTGMIVREGFYNAEEKKHGIWIEYYEDGSPKTKGSFTNGFESGKWRTWDAKGKKTVVKHENLLK